ncbi:TPA: hypothetical protein ACGQS5_004761 [Serratia liquefaciens]
MRQLSSGILITALLLVNYAAIAAQTSPSVVRPEVSRESTHVANTKKVTAENEKKRSLKQKAEHSVKKNAQKKIVHNAEKAAVRSLTN